MAALAWVAARLGRAGAAAFGQAKLGERRPGGGCCAVLGDAFVSGAAEEGCCAGVVGGGAVRIWIYPRSIWIPKAAAAA